MRAASRRVRARARPRASALAFLLSRDAVPDAVDRFLADVELPRHADAFRAMGYHRAEDFFGITEPRTRGRTRHVRRPP